MNPISAQELQSLATSIANRLAALLGVSELQAAWPYIYNPLAASFGYPTVEPPRLYPIGATTVPEPGRGVTSEGDGAAPGLDLAATGHAGEPALAASGFDQASVQQSAIDGADTADGSLERRDAGTGQIVDSPDVQLSEDESTDIALSDDPDPGDTSAH